MNKVIYFKNKYFHESMKKQFHNLSQKILDHYKKQAETAYCIEQIENEAVMHYQNKMDIPFLMSEFDNEIAMAQDVNKHYVIRVIDNKQLQVAVHIASVGTSIPVHAHPDSLSLLFVQQGELLLKQFSTAGDSKRSIRLKEKGCSVGLKHLYNMHSVEVTKPGTVFISLRCKTKRSHKWLTQAISLMVYGASTIFSPSYACSGFEGQEDQDQLGFEETVQQDELESIDIANGIRVRANNDDEMFYKASKWYLKAASEENAEAEYWLGVMYLKGMGITENSDEALMWIARSADKEYSPAKKLLKYILSHDEALDC